MSHGAAGAGGLRRTARALSAIRTRWLVAATIGVVAAIGALVYFGETERSEAGLGDLASEQSAVARAASLSVDRGPALELAALEERGVTVVLIGDSHGALKRLDGRPVVIPELREAIAGGATTFRLARADAPLLDLPERTAMVGIAHSPGGAVVAVVASAERQRDRDRRGMLRVLLSMLFAAAVMSGFAAILWKQQRVEAQLADELAVAESARARDAELVRLSRIATMSALGSGVASELSTPLGVITVRAEQLITRANGDERTTKSAQAIIDQTTHLGTVVRGLLTLARGAPIAMKETTAQALVTKASELVEHRFQAAGVSLVPKVSSKLPPVRCESILLEHALVALLLNACEASARGGTVRVDVQYDANEIAFAITDDGDGIAAAAAKRAVEPLFTTKPAGVGLSLAIANEIAKVHRGVLEIAPLSPKGTRAWIRIPIEGAKR